MKKIYLIIFLFIASIGIAQDFSKNGVYVWIEAVKLQPCNFNGTPDISKDPIASIAGQKFRVLEVTSTASAIIQVIDYTDNLWSWKTKSKRPSRKLTPRREFYKYNFKGTETEYNSLKDEEVNAREYGSRQYYFTVPIKDIQDENLCKREEFIGASLAVGALNFPFKYRPQTGDLSGAFNFGIAVGINIKHKSWRKFNSSLVLGFSFTNVVLDSTNASRNQGQLASTNNFSAGSLSLGFLVQNGRVQLGAFLGVDRLSNINQKQFDWKYQGKPWLSLGLGIGVFAPQDSKVSTTVSQ